MLRVNMLFIVTQIVFAQNKFITGIVVDSVLKDIICGVVIISGNQKVTTNIDGRFSLAVEEENDSIFVVT